MAAVTVLDFAITLPISFCHGWNMNFDVTANGYHEYYTHKDKPTLMLDNANMDAQPHQP